MSPKVSVLIVSWNSAAHLPRCLAALAEQSYQDFEVIILDNASTDYSAFDSGARWPSLQLRTERLESNLGFAAANNVGARLADGQWLALLNPDAFPAADWLEQLVQASAEYPGSFFASRQIQADRPSLLDGDGDTYYSSGLSLRTDYNRPYSDSSDVREVFSACAAAAMYPREAFLAAGGFDEDYFAYHEDVDLGFRLRLCGLRCFLVPTAVVHHVGAASTGRRSNFAIYHGHRNLVWTFIKDMPSPWCWFYLPLHISMNLVSIGYFVLGGHGTAILRAKLDALRGLPRALTKRRRIQAETAVRGAVVVRQINTNPLGPLQGWISRRRYGSSP